MKKKHSRSHQRGAAPARPAAAEPASPPRRDSGRPSHPEDAASNDRLARSLALNAGRTALSRHRERITGIENEEDGVPNDEDSLEEAAQAEIDLDAEGLHRHRAVP